MQKHSFLLACLILLLLAAPLPVMASKAAVLFMEMEKIDTDAASLAEVMSIYMLSGQLNKGYDKLFWLVNNSATKDAFILNLQAALKGFTTVDVYVLSHGGMQYFSGHFADRIYVDDILGFKTMPSIDHLRFVYLGTCHSWDLADEFIEIGAKAVIGSASKMVNFPFLGLFLNNFVTLGYPLKTALNLSQLPVDDGFKLKGNGAMRFKDGQ